MTEKGLTMNENLTYDDDTLHKVYAALAEVGLERQQVIDAVSLMQNAGILFREHAPVIPPGERT